MCLVVRHISGEYSLIFLCAIVGNWSYALVTAVVVDLHPAIYSTEFAYKVVCLCF